MNKILLFSLASYVIGSISGSLLLGKLWNIDIRNFGSKSAGGTNALRTVGFVFALLTFIIDLSKGLIPTYLIACYSNYNEIEMMIGGFATIIGHVYPIFYRFNGGKGAATLVGTLIILNPLSLVYVLSRLLKYIQLISFPKFQSVCVYVYIIPGFFIFILISILKKLLHKYFSSFFVIVIVILFCSLLIR